MRLQGMRIYMNLKRNMMKAGLIKASTLIQGYSLLNTNPLALTGGCYVKLRILRKPGDSRMKNSIPSRLKTLIPLLSGALLISMAAAVSAIEPRLPSGSKNDTTADGVLGQLDFLHRGRNLIDGYGLDTSPSIVGDIVIDKSVTPHRVYVVDRDNQRVLGWKNISAFTTHAAADVLIGQPDFTSNACNISGVSPTTLCNPTGAAVDSAGNLYVADTSNHRVLFYKTPFSSDKAADDVFGQYGNLTSNVCNNPGSISENSLCNPVRVTLDKADNLYISDQLNHRVLEFNTPEAITGVVGSGDTTADRVFGQFGVFNTGACNNTGISAESLCDPIGIDVDTQGNLYIVDHSNHRVLKFITPLTTDTTADKVYGQLNKFTTNVCNNTGVNSKSLCQPLSVAVDPSGVVFIADRGNHRVLGYPSTGNTTTTANKSLGQFRSLNANTCNNTGGGTLPPVNNQSLCNPDGLAFDTSVSPNSPNLYVSDTSNNRVLQYKPSKATRTDPTLVIKNGQAASGVLGQSLLTTNFQDAMDGRGFTFSDANAGTVAIDTSVSPNRVYVADYASHRVLAWSDIAAFTSHAPAKLVFGQPNFFTNTVNNGGISGKSLNHPRGIAVDGNGNLFIADQDNHRVLIYKTPFTTDAVADIVLGQAGSMLTADCNHGGVSTDSLCTPVGLALDSANNLYVGDFSNHRVLAYNKPLTTDATADKVYGQAGDFGTNSCNLGGVSADSLCNPHGIAVDTSDNLYVADWGNHRVLEFNKLPLTDMTADKVFGQANDFTANICNGIALSATSLCNPRFVAVNSAKDVFIADSGNNRVLKYTTPLTTDRKADRVFGQGNLFYTNSCKTVSPNALCVPDGIALDAADNLYVTDTNNNRVLQFLKP